MLAHAWSWLAVHGSQDLLAALTGGAATRVLGWRPRDHAQRMDRIEGKVDQVAKIIATSPPVGATTAGPAVSNSIDTHPSDHPKPASGGGGTK